MKPTPSPSEIAAAYTASPGLYLIGSLERGVTVYNQQVRAHNLAWALHELAFDGGDQPLRIAVVGGGVAGLTITSCLLTLFKLSTVTLFEQLWDLCPLQQGSDTRWLHPKIYDWPNQGSRAPSASLPVLNWSEGRASDVAKTILFEFGQFAKAFAPGDRLRVYLGLQHFQINGRNREISWIAHKATRTKVFFDLSKPEGNIDAFDIIILTPGFGLETETKPYQSSSYWRNEQMGQPQLEGGKQSYIVSGFGDGALVDLCRLTIERFRQDTIVYELFEPRLADVEQTLRSALGSYGRDKNLFELFQNLEATLLKDPIEELRHRLRKDTRVILHLRGRNAEVQAFPQIFGPRSSFFNRLMTYMLYRAGAFALDFRDIASAVSRYHVPTSNVLCRYGANTTNHLRRLFVDGEILTTRLIEMKAKQAQIAERLWVPGSFPQY